MPQGVIPWHLANASQVAPHCGLNDLCRSINEPNLVDNHRHGYNIWVDVIAQSALPTALAIA
eukprot:SAG31_NODE_1379_length_8582_cov_17.482848_2_plen_62_part_00